MTIFHRCSAVALALIVTSGAAGLAARQNYSVSKDDSTVMFTISKWMVFKEEGRFRDFEGDIRFDPERPEATEVTFVVQVASVDTKKRGRDEKLLSADFFHAEKYPVMSFSSTKVAADGARRLQVTGDLTIRGVTKRITVPVTVLGVTEVDDPPVRLAGFETTFVIDRTDFGVLGEQWSGGKHILGHDVTVHIIASASTPSSQ